MTEAVDTETRENTRAAILRRINDKNLLLGLLLLAIAAIVFITASGYPTGTSRRMGPGYFPILLAGILTLFSVILIGRSFFFEREPIEQFSGRPALFVLGGAAIFGLLLLSGGLIMSIVVMVCVAALASPHLGLRASLILAGVLAIGNAVVFVKLLGQQLPLLGSWFGG